ncbi:hypothetical protein [Neoroseomonas rubea]|uniref:hypothetical protein n=1 Tax=Neoroseomonas rubea TaxID=2748666 RepID=UPI0018DF9D77|nr:hypothetical protein [Roseomonas rubea]
MTDASRPADRLAVLLREAVGGLDRQAAHDMLDAALDIAAEAGDAPKQDARDLAQAAALVLSRAVASWTLPVRRPPEEWDQLAADNPAAWREDAAACMAEAYAVVPQAVLGALMFGLHALNDASPPPSILVPAEKAAGYGRNPRSRREIEQSLLAFIAAEKAAGRPVSAVRTHVATAVGQSVDAIETWAREWRKRDGGERVKGVLAAAAAFGRGEHITAPVPDEIILVRLLGLRGLADSWKAARR